MTTILWASVGLVGGFVGGVASTVLLLYLKGSDIAEKLLRELMDSREEGEP